jgi:hypothetical protein
MADALRLIVFFVDFPALPRSFVARCGCSAGKRSAKYSVLSNCAQAPQSIVGFDPVVQQIPSIGSDPSFGSIMHRQHRANFCMCVFCGGHYTWRPAGFANGGKRIEDFALNKAIQAGQKKFVDIRVPALAIYAAPIDLGPWVHESEDPAVRAAAAAFIAKQVDLTEKQSKAFQDGVLSLRAVRLKNANHYVFLSNEADVLREMRSFLSMLK